MPGDRPESAVHAPAREIGHARCQADHGRQRPAVVAAVRALQVEVVVPPIAATRDVTQESVRSIGVDQQRFLAQAVRIGVGRAFASRPAWPASSPCHRPTRPEPVASRRL